MVVTLAFLAGGAGLFALAGYLARRPRELGKLQWIPYNGVQFVALVIVILAIAHLISLLTGQPLEGRFSR